jgi:hypothetical protein
MFEVGDYVEVDLGNEVRRGIVATIEDGAMGDVILLQEYGNNKTGEVIDEAEYPTFSLMSVKKLEGGKSQPSFLATRTGAEPSL